MKHLGISSILGIALVLTGCGGGKGKDAGKAFVGAFGAASGAASGHSIARLVNPQISTALRQAGMRADSLVWGAYFRSRYYQERRAKWCDTVTASSAYSGSNISCTVGCPSDKFTIGCTTSASFSAACGTTTYTLATGGTFSISWPNADIGTGSGLPNPVGVDMNVKLTGGGLTNAEVKIAFSFNVSDLASADASTDICSHVTNFSGSVDGSSFSCGDLRDGTKECK